MEKPLAWFTDFSKWVAEAAIPITFSFALLTIIVWAALSDRCLVYSDTWQLVINTGTTIATFLIVFLIQKTQTATLRQYT